MDNLENWKRKAIAELQLTHKLSMAALPSVTARPSPLNPTLSPPSLQSPLRQSTRPPLRPPLASNGASRGRNFHGFDGEQVSMFDVNRLVELTRPLYRQHSLRQELLPPPLPPAPYSPSMLSSALTRAIAPQTRPPTSHLQLSSPRTHTTGAAPSAGGNPKQPPKLYRGATAISVQHPRERSALVESESSGGGRMGPTRDHHLEEVSAQSESASLRLTGRTIASEESRRLGERSYTAFGARTGNVGRLGAKGRYRSTATLVPRTSPNEAETAEAAGQSKSTSSAESPMPPGANASASASPTAACCRTTPAGAEKRAAAEWETRASQVSWSECGGVNYRVTSLSSGDGRLLDCSSVASQASGLLQRDASPFYVLHMDVPQRGLTKIFAPKYLTSFQIMKILLGTPLRAHSFENEHIV